ncbi:MAG TPA: hypothetical protein VGD94_08280 [Vicinamibacterales bacterium]
MRAVRGTVAGFAALLLANTVNAQGLGGRVALEAIASAATSARALDDPNVIFDLVGTVRLADGLDVVVRPWTMRRPGGDWMFEMYQLQVRYVSPTRVPFRVDAGIIPSPVGLFTLELQAHRNPLIDPPFYYISPLPPLSGTPDRARLVTGGYPLGAMVSVSGTRWDARAGVTDSTPVSPRNVFGESQPSAHPQLVLGGGFTPVMGLRLGAGFARGRYEPRFATIAGSASAPRTATLFNVEGEYAFGHTRLAGEWIRDRFETPAGTAVARGFNVQIAQTLTPRIFAAARATHVSSPVHVAPVEERRTSTEFDLSLGYRLTPALTVRGGYRRERVFRDTRPSNAAVMSLVWAERWW